MDAAAEGSLRPLVSGSVSGLHITTRGSASIFSYAFKGPLHHLADLAFP
jgi:hypothetical protein